MARNKLTKLKQEINHYLGLPYMINILRDNTVIKEKFMGAKGTWQQIEAETKKIALQEKIKLSDFTSKQLYNFQKKHHLGIDCSGLASNLLIFYSNLINKKINLNVRQTSANMLTSNILSRKIKNSHNIQTGDLVRQKNGHHVLFIIEKKGGTIFYVESCLKNRKVSLGQFDLSDHSFDNQGIYRLFLFE